MALGTDRVQSIATYWVTDWIESLGQRRSSLISNLLFVWFLVFGPSGVSLGPAYLVYASSSEDMGRQGAVIEKVVVDVSDSAPKGMDWQLVARELITFHEGEQFSSARLDEALAALSLSRQFQTVDASIKETQAGVVVSFRVVPFKRIKDIRVSGQSPLFEREILNAMTTRVGDVFDERVLAIQEASITAALKREGFVAPRVNIHSEEDASDGHIVLKVELNNGGYYRIKKLKLEGNWSMPTPLLQVKLNVWLSSQRIGSSGRFIESDLKADIEKLVGYYREKGYADCRIEPEVQKDEAAREVSLRLKIFEGPKYAVRFDGNSEFGDTALSKKLTIFKDGNPRDLGLRRSAQAIEELYQQAGYVDVKVTIEGDLVKKEKASTRKIRFVVKEGPRAKIRAIRIEGNHVFDNERVLAQMLTQVDSFVESGVFVPEILEEDLYSIQTLYLKAGYIKATVDHVLEWSDDRANITLVIKITEGAQTLLSAILIEGMTAIPEQQARSALGLEPGLPFRQHLVQSDANTLASMISEKGYPHVNVKGEFVLSEDGSTAKVIFKVEQGPLVRLGHVYYAGNFRTKQRIIDRRLLIHPGDPFSLEKVLKSQKNIRDLQIFRAVQVTTIGLKEKRQWVDLLVEVEERKPFIFESGVGYNSYKGLNANAKVGDYNLFGRNKYGWVAGQASQTGQLAHVELGEPNLFGEAISATLGAFAEKQADPNKDYGTVTYGSSLGLGRKLNKWLFAGLSFRYERRDQFQRTTSTSSTQDLGEGAIDSRSMFVSAPSISVDTRDSFISPKKGIYSSLSTEISKGLTNSLDDFVKPRLDFRYYLSPVKRLTFAWLGRGGIIIPYNNLNQFPEDQLFFLGGTLDVRGFGENMLRVSPEGKPVGGRTSVVGSMESRVDLGMNWELTLFYDTGALTGTNSETNSGAFRSSVGIGLRHVTPIGPIGFLYGRKLNPLEGEGPGHFHFSLGYTF